MLPFILLKLSSEFDSIELIGLYVVVYNLAASLAQPLFEWIYSGARHAACTLFYALIGLQVGWVICGLSHSSWVFLLGQVLFGFSAVGILRGIEILEDNLRPDIATNIYVHNTKKIWLFEAAPKIAKASGPL